MTKSAENGKDLVEKARSAARRYRTSWLELAQVLVEVRRSEAWKESGATTFDEFVTRDLSLKASEAHQLIANYGFLEKHEKKVLDKPIEQVKLPDAKVINLLEKAEQRGQLTDKEYDGIRDRVWDPEVTTAELTRDITGRFPAPPPPEPSPAQRLKRLANTGNRFLEEVRSSRQIPTATKERLAAAIEEIEEIAENHQGARA